MDLSKLPDSQRQELEQLQKQFQEHQAQRQSAAAVQQQQPPPYDPFHVHQPYDPSRAYNQSYYYNYHRQSQQQHQSHQQYDASYYQSYYPNSYQQHPATAPNELQRNEESGPLGLGRFQDPYVNAGNQVNMGYPGPSGLNPTAAAAAAVAALSQLTQFAGTMAAPMAARGNYVPGHFRPPPGGGRRGGFRSHGRGRGRGGRGGRSDHPPSSNPGSSTRTAWCEVCRVDCTTIEVLEEHNKGRRHKKNLEKLQHRNQQTETPIPPESEPDKQTQVGDGDGDGNNKVEENENEEKKPARMKRKIKGRVRGSRGGVNKRMRPTGPRNPKVVIPLVCDLCNIKCDTQEVFDRHVAGKKHMSKLKKFQGHQAMYGPTAVQALYPPNPLSQTYPPPPPPQEAAAAAAYIPPPYQPPNPQLADAPLEFATRNAPAVLTG